MGTAKLLVPLPHREGERWQRTKMITWKTLRPSQKRSLMSRLTRWLFGGKEHQVMILTEQTSGMPTRIGSISSKETAPLLLQAKSQRN